MMAFVSIRRMIRLNPYEHRTTLCCQHCSHNILNNFGPAFILVFLAITWVGIDDFRERATFMTFGTICGTVTFGLIYTLLRLHQQRGDYIVIDDENDRVELPRHGRSFSRNQVNCLQLLTGNDQKAESSNDSDLNLIVSDGPDLVRYHLIGNPNKKQATELAEAMRKPLIEQIVPDEWNRSSDRNDVSEC